MNDKTAEQKVLDGSVWDEFCDSLKTAGHIIRSEKAPQDAFNQAEGYRYLTRLLRGGLESFLEFGDNSELGMLYNFSVSSANSVFWRTLFDENVDWPLLHRWGTFHRFVNSRMKGLFQTC